MITAITNFVPRVRCRANGTAGVISRITRILTCMVDWIADHSTGYPIPANGMCRSLFDVLVVGMTDLAPADVNNAGCGYDAE